MLPRAPHGVGIRIREANSHTTSVYGGELALCRLHYFTARMA